MNKRAWVVFTVVVILLVGALVWWKSSSRDDIDAVVANLDESKLLTAADVGDGQIPDHYVGPADSRVVVIEYEDYGCSHCHQFAPVVRQIHADYKDRVLFIYRNFVGVQPNSGAGEKAAEAAYVAGGDVAYWQMHDKLFSEERWGSYAIPVDEKNSLIHDYAREIGLDQAKFDAALAATGDNGISDKISRDKALAMKADVKGTPSFFVNGQAVTLDSDGQSFRDAIDQALEQTNQK